MANSATSQNPPAGMYPRLTATHIENPNRFYAVPIIGMAVKIIMLIPVFIFFVFLGIAALFIMVINSFIVLFSGEYWDTAYTFNLSLFRYQTKLMFFFSGLSNSYPGFTLANGDMFTVDIEKPAKPNRFFAIPVIGGLVRVILLIPYLIYDGILQRGAGLGTVISSFPVLVNGRYPESTFEFNRDSHRISLAAGAYMSGLSDNYPKWWISMNHQTIKIPLIIAGVILTLTNFGSSFTNQRNQNKYRYQQNYSQQFNSQSNYNYGEYTDPSGNKYGAQ